MRPEKERAKLALAHSLLLKALQSIDDDVAAEHLRNALKAIERELDLDIRADS